MADHFDVFMLTLGALGANCFLLASGGKALIVDPGDEADVVAAACDEIAAAPQAILVTHGHFDHIGGVDALARQFAVPVYVGEADAGDRYRIACIVQRQVIVLQFRRPVLRKRIFETSAQEPTDIGVAIGNAQ